MAYSTDPQAVDTFFLIQANTVVTFAVVAATIRRVQMYVSMLFPYQPVKPPPQIYDVGGDDDDDQILKP